MMPEPFNAAVLAQAHNDFQRLAASFPGLFALGAELGKIASIERQIKDSETRHAAALAQETATKSRIEQEAQAMRDAAAAEVTAILERTQQKAQEIAKRAATDADLVLAKANADREAIAAGIKAKHRAADQEIAAKHANADRKIAEDRANALATLDREIAAGKQRLADLKAEIARIRDMLA